MTGLDREKDTILSLACFVTDARLNLLDPNGFEKVIHHDQAALNAMGEWCTAQHAKSGLTAAALASKTTHEEAAASLLSYIQNYIPEARRGLLAGSSVHCDKAYLDKPPYDKVMEHLHYRILDVSSIKEAALRWADDKVVRKRPAKKGLHQAREDILESIEEARYWRDVLFMPK